MEPKDGTKLLVPTTENSTSVPHFPPQRPDVIRACAAATEISLLLDLKCYGHPLEPLAYLTFVLLDAIGNSWLFFLFLPKKFTLTIFSEIII